MMRTAQRVQRLEDVQRNPYAGDRRMTTLMARLSAGVDIRTFNDDDLDYMIAAVKRTGARVSLNVAAMSDEELERAMDGDESVLARYRTVAL